MVPKIYGKGVIVAPMLDGHILVEPIVQEGISKEDIRITTQEKFSYIGEIGKKLFHHLIWKKQLCH